MTDLIRRYIGTLDVEIYSMVSDSTDLNTIVKLAQYINPNTTSISPYITRGLEYEDNN